MNDQEKATADLVIKNAAQLLTCTGDAPDSVGIVQKGWVGVIGDKIGAVGSEEEVKAALDCSKAKVIDAEGKVVAPGFVDCHTHLVFGGSRVREYAARMTVDDTKELEKKGIKTGIMVSVGMTREASEEALFQQAGKRLREMLCAGTTTVESKSGYGLSTTAEIKMLKINEYLNEAFPVDVVSTFLGAHGWPDDISREAYRKILTLEMIPWVAELKLARFCDIWCDEGHYTAEESAEILQAAREVGLEPKIHTDAYSYIKGSDLAAEMKMISADHLNYTPRRVMRKLAEADVPGVLLPALDFAVRHPQPFDARSMLEEGMTVALATNLCPGCWTQSMQFVMALACRLYRMSPAEAVRAATRGAAKALNLESDRGSLEVGKLADIQIWNAETFEDVIYHLGGNLVEKVVKSGKLVVDHTKSGYLDGVKDRRFVG